MGMAATAPRLFLAMTGCVFFHSVGPMVHCASGARPRADVATQRAVEVLELLRRRLRAPQPESLADAPQPESLADTPNRTRSGFLRPSWEPAGTSPLSRHPTQKVRWLRPEELPLPDDYTHSGGGAWTESPTRSPTPVSHPPVGQGVGAYTIGGSTAGIVAVAYAFGSSAWVGGPPPRQPSVIYIVAGAVT